MYLSSHQVYGVRFLQHLRRTPGLVPLAQLAYSVGITREYASNVLCRLSKAHLIRGKQGRGGGYVLADRQHEASVLDVVKAIPRKQVVAAMRKPEEELRDHVESVISERLDLLKVDQL